MHYNYQLSCESTVDLPFSYVDSRGISVLFYDYMVDGVTYPDDMGRDPEALPRFYNFLSDGKLPTTSQVNIVKYTDYFEKLLQKGDVLHIAFGSGMTQSVANAMVAAETLREEYPARKMIVIDALCSSSGYGLLVDAAADMRDSGASMEEIEKWVTENRNKVHHQLFSTDLTFFRRSGRMSGSAATVATVLNIRPIMRLDDGGRIIAYDKVRGTKNAIRETVRTMAEHAQGGTGYSGKCFICNSNCIAIAEELRKAVKESFPNIDGDIRMCDIGPNIAAHCGPGTVAVFFFGDERLPDKE
jgi:DegV family protein with EDD domain